MIFHLKWINRALKLLHPRSPTHARLVFHLFPSSLRLFYYPPRYLIAGCLRKCSPMLQMFEWVRRSTNFPRGIIWICVRVPVRILSFLGIDRWVTSIRFDPFGSMPALLTFPVAAAATESARVETLNTYSAEVRAVKRNYLFSNVYSHDRWEHPGARGALLSSEKLLFVV